MGEYLKDITFVVIALNEEYAMPICLESILKLKKQNCEVICIDSGSKDKTLEIMKSYSTSFDEIKIFQVDGDVNASVARNIGIKYAKKKYLFFVDGDVEILGDFLAVALKRIEYYGAICGNLEEVEYTFDYSKVLNQKLRYPRTIEMEVSLFGGIFLTKSSVFQTIGLFDEKLGINEDNDFSLRMSMSEKILYIPVIVGRHHTIPYQNPKRLMRQIKNEDSTNTSLLIKKNIKNPKLFQFLVTRPEIFFGIPFYSLCFLILLTMEYDLFVLIALLFITDMIYGKYKKRNLPHRFVMHYINPIFVVKGFFKKSIPKKYIVKIIE